jgi:O-antigen ligase
MGAVAVALMDHLRDLRVRLGLAVLLVVLFISLIYTQSRASYLAVIPTYVIIAFFSRKRFYLLAGLILAIALSPVIVPRVAKDRMAQTFTQPEGKGQIQFGRLRLDTSASSRIIGFKEAILAWLKSPFIGYGVTGFRFMDAQYPRILVETGIIGMLAFTWLVYTLFRVGIIFKKDHEDELLQGLCVGLISGLVGLLVHAIGANTFIIVRIMEPFWFLTGIVVALSTMGEDRIEAIAF